MEFKNQYLTYDEFVELGGELDEMPFSLLEFKARKIIDNQTFGRLEFFEEIPMEVKMCMLELINRLYTINEQSKGNVASESIDGYSVQYATDSEAKTQEALGVLVWTYLHDTEIDGFNILNRMV